MADLARVLRAAADECDRIVAEQAAGHCDWISQADSPLGRKRHCAAVRRHLERGLDGVAIVGRRHLLSPEALRAALAEVGRPAPKASSVTKELEHKLRLVGGSL